MPQNGRKAFMIGFLICFTLTLLCLSPVTLYSRNTILRIMRPNYWKPTPTYSEIIQLEKSLPQHNLSLPYPEGKTGRYVRFSNQIAGLGWNNVLNEILLCSHLAWRAKRAYVFQDYAWKTDYYPWPVPNWPWPRTPLNALVAGPIAGGSWERGDYTPRAIRADYWPEVCPPEDTEVIGTYAAKEPIRNADAKYALEHWLRLLNESPKRCVDIVPETKHDNFPQTFDLWLISTPRVLSIWPEFRDSPVSRLLKASPLVQSAVEHNEHLFHFSAAQNNSDRYESMMAIHVRRGDYLGACQGLSDWSSTFYQWNLLPELPDSFVVPPGGSGGSNTPQNEALYFRRCFPTEDQLVEKIRQSKLEWETGGDGKRRKQGLTRLYVMTNAEISWQDDFRSRLIREGWETVVFGSDLVLDDEQMTVSMAIDMDIGRMAGVFIGNGWSSMTSNIVHRRLVDRHDPLSIRFW